MISTLMIILCVVLRLVPHPANFAPVGATAVFAGRTLSPRKALLTLFALMFVSDVLLAGFRGYPLATLATPFVYAGFAVQVWLGRRFRSARGGMIGATFFGAIAFFLLSNFGVWVEGYYGWTVPGLVACYAAALPFFRATVLGDLFWIAVLTLGYDWISARSRKPSVVVPANT
jgi:hypothetical protein